MTKLQDVVIKTHDKGLQEHIEDLVLLWNSGKIGFTKTASSTPTDTPSDVELRFWSSGGGVAQMFVFIPGSASSGIGWWKSDGTASSGFSEVV